VIALCWRSRDSLLVRCCDCLRAQHSSDPGQINHSEIRHTSLLDDKSERSTADAFAAPCNLVGRSIDRLGDARLRCGDLLVLVLQVKLGLLKRRLILQPHYERDSSADALATREADAGKGLEHAGLAARLITDHDDCWELDAFLHDLEMSKAVDGIKEWADLVVVGVGQG